LEVLPVFYKWSQGRVTEARSEFLRLEPRDRPQGVFFVWSLGELAEAEKYARGESDDSYRTFELGANAYIQGDFPTARKQFRKIVKDMSFFVTGFDVMIQTGLWKEVEARIRERPPDNPAIQILRGEIAISRGQTKEGIALLERGIEAMRNFPLGSFYLGSQMLARTYEKQSNLDAALRVLRQASDAKGKAYNCLSGGPMNGVWWLADELQLADLYRKMGRVSEAEQVEDELRKMVIYADADHPIVLELKKREQLKGKNTNSRDPV